MRYISRLLRHLLHLMARFLTPQGRRRSSASTVDGADLGDYYTKAEVDALVLAIQGLIDEKLGRARQARTIISSANITSDWDLYDMVQATALAANTTLANPTGSPGDGQDMMYILKDGGGGPWTISYGTDFRAMGTTLPTATVAGKITYIFCKWNTVDSKMDVLATAQQA